MYFQSKDLSCLPQYCERQGNARNAWIWTKKVRSTAIKTNTAAILLGQGSIPLSIYSGSKPPQKQTGGSCLNCLSSTNQKTCIAVRSQTELWKEKKKALSSASGRHFNTFTTPARFLNTIVYALLKGTLCILT